MSFGGSEPCHRFDDRVTKHNILSFFVGQLGRFIDLNEAKRQYLLTYNVSRYCLLALHGSIHVQTDRHWEHATDYRLNTPSFEGALQIDIVVSLFCLILSH